MGLLRLIPLLLHHFWENTHPKTAPVDLYKVQGTQDEVTLSVETSDLFTWVWEPTKLPVVAVNPGLSSF